MKKFFICLLASVVAVLAYVPEADARRMGGGSSFGMQRSVKPPAQRAPAAAPQRNATPATAPKSRSWLGIAGIAAELGLALFSHLRWAPAGFWAPFILSMMKRNSTATSDQRKDNE